MKSVLLIEDNQDDYEAMYRGFASIDKNYPFKRCVGSTEALRFLDERSVSELPSLIILDLNMPGMNGYELLCLLKKTKKYKRIPVIVFSGSGKEEVITKCYEAGANTCMQKPVNFVQMKKLCNKLHAYWFNFAILTYRDTEMIAANPQDSQAFDEGVFAVQAKESAI